MSTNQLSENSGTRSFVATNDLNESGQRPAPIADNEQYGITPKM